MNHKNYLSIIFLAFSLCTNPIRASFQGNNSPKSFECTHLTSECKNGSLVLDRHNCDVKVDYHHKTLYGVCKFKVTNESRCKEFIFNINLKLEDSQGLSVWPVSIFSVPTIINPSEEAKEVRIGLAGSKKWTGKLIKKVVPRIEILRSEYTKSFKIKFAACVIGVFVIVSMLSIAVYMLAKKKLKRSKNV